MNKKVSIGVTLALIIISVALTVSITTVVAMRQFNNIVNDVGKRQVMLDYVTEIDKLVREHVSNLDEEKLRTALAQGYIDGIDDPYAAYLTADEYATELSAKEGKVTGFGVELTRSSSGEIVVSQVQKNSPAAAAGLQRYDVITAVDSVPIAQLGLTEARSRLAGNKKIILTYTRDGESKALDISASLYNTVSVESYLLNDITGYIRIRAFNNLTFEQFKAAYAALESQGATHFIYDVRNVSGGSLSAAESIAGYLLPRGVYAYRIDLKAGTETQLKAEDTFETDKTSVTLVNTRTSGVAEFFAGVLQERGKTTVLGTKTAGSGMVQEYFTITSNGSAIRLSVASLNLLNGSAIEKVGITPDVEVEMPADQLLYFELLAASDDAQIQAALKALENGPPVTPSTTQPPETTDTTTPDQTEPSASTAASSAEE